MKKTLIKLLTIGLLGAMVIGSFAGCSTEKKDASSSSSIEEKDSEKDGDEDVDDKDKGKDGKAVEGESKVTEPKETKGSTEEVVSSNGRFSTEGVPLFEEIYKSDAIKDFKINFVKEACAMFDKVDTVLPQDLKSSLFTSKKLVKHEGPIYEYNFQTTGSKEGRSKTNNLYGVFGKVNCDDSTKGLDAVQSISISFRTGNDKEIVFDENTKNILKNTITEFTPEELEAKVNESYKNNGKSIYLLEEKNKKLTIGSNIMSSGNSAQIDYKIIKDYPQ